MSKHIVVVENDVMALELMRRLLAAGGYACADHVGRRPCRSRCYPRKHSETMSTALAAPAASTT